MKHARLSAGILSAVLLLSGCGAGKGPMKEDAQVTLCDYVGIEATMKDGTVTEEDIDSSLDSLLEYQSWNMVSERTVAQDGDSVFATVEMKDMDGNLVDDGSSSYGIVDIGSGNTHPEVEAVLIGMNVGDTKEVEVQLPDPYEYNEELSGRKLMASVTLNGVRSDEELSRSTLTDEQASRIFGMDSVEALREDIRSQLASNQENLRRTTAYDQICSYLLENCTVDPFPDGELADRVEAQVDDIKGLCKEYYDMTFQEYLDSNGMTEEELRDSIKSQYEDTIRLELIFTAIADKEGIEYTEEEYQSYIDEVTVSSGYADAAALYEDYEESYVRMAYRIEKVVDWLIENADIVTTESGEGSAAVPEGSFEGELEEGPEESSQAASEENSEDSSEEASDEQASEEPFEKSSEEVSGEQASEESSEAGSQESSEAWDEAAEDGSEADE